MEVVGEAIFHTFVVEVSAEERPSHLEATPFTGLLSYRTIVGDLASGIQEDVEEARTRLISDPLYNESNNNDAGVRALFELLILKAAGKIVASHKTSGHIAGSVLDSHQFVTSADVQVNSTYE